MDNVEDKSVDLVVTSPPYPMIEMWDQQFFQMNPQINEVLARAEGIKAFELMHQELDKTWNEIYRVVKDGAIICLNIGDATRKIGDSFQLFSNHARILNHFVALGVQILPEILWRKQSNKPNKFMGSGMLPPSAYVTQEHEYILILRKGKNREFKEESKRIRDESAYFWEERNTWFSDIWTDLKGIDQKLNTNFTQRERSAAYPFELVYRLINMFSVKGDLVLDPFLGTGTTLMAAMASARNSIGFEVDQGFKKVIQDRIQNTTNFLNDYLVNRVTKHLDFIEEMDKNKKVLKYQSELYKFKVVTNQETKIRFNFIKEIKETNGTHETFYFDEKMNQNIIENIINNCQIDFNPEEGKITFQQKLR
ncbi:MAG: site-specific DNA-methyltransferase [Candidatus Helarchaeota archaeon]|nr:site-specific DNA-methyltransferase [Candidatus Helarchaeota archaeon]